VLILHNRNAGAKIWFIDISPFLLRFFRLKVAARCLNLSVCRASEHLLAGKGSRASCLILRGVGEPLILHGLCSNSRHKICSNT
jgi:hypothetical protein